jgi:hypothetical protein
VQAALLCSTGANHRSTGHDPSETEARKYVVVQNKSTPVLKRVDNSQSPLLRVTLASTGEFIKDCCRRAGGFPSADPAGFENSAKNLWPIRP